MTDSAVTPAVARRRVRLALREAREAAHYTQSQVAEEMEWSLSKVIRIENGDVSIGLNDLRALCAFLGIKDRATVAAMLTDAKISRSRTKPWWNEPAYREHLSEALRRLIEYEAEAVAIRYYNVHFFPGPVQTPQYGEALLKMWQGEIREDGRIETRLTARRLRHEALLARLGTFDLRILLDESVLLRPIGGYGVFADQLRLLHSMGTDSKAKIRMIPFDPVTPLTNNASFDLVTLHEDGLLLYRENGLTDELIEDPSSTARHLSRFDKVWSLATDEVNTNDYIGRRISALEAKSSQAKI